MPSHSHRVTFGNIEFHEPCLLSECQFIQIFLKKKKKLLVFRPSRYFGKGHSHRQKARIVKFMLSGRSLMKIKNNMGSITEPWRTPENTGTGSESTPIKDSFLCLSRQPGRDLLEDIMSDTIILKLLNQSSMGNLIESLGKVHNNNGPRLCFSVNHV